ncbi:unnamed protein product [Lactuca virosa]|uniref:Uncharacterized protein n=1 Tax=Lactuca virosa TaxID=75947 RepID=A0AAU9NED0_9ASTR|nr:unnamed protein product [Lactuca virosa]
MQSCLFRLLIFKALGKEEVSEVLVSRNRSTIIVPARSTRDEGWSAFRNTLEEINEASKLFVLPNQENGIINKGAEEGANQSIPQGQKSKETSFESDKKQSAVTSSTSSSKMEGQVPKTSKYTSASKTPSVSPSPGLVLSKRRWDPVSFREWGRMWFQSLLHDQDHLLMSPFPFPGLHQMQSRNENVDGEEDHLQHPTTSSSNVPENLPTEGDMSSNAGPEYRELKQETSSSSLPTPSHQYPAVHTSANPNFSFAFMPPMIGS